jgi:spore germination protein YaaH
MKPLVRAWQLSLAVSAFAFATAGCGVESAPEGRVEAADVTAIPARTGTALVDSCVLDSWHRDALSPTGSARKVLGEIVMLCLVPRFDGSVGPSDPAGASALADVVKELHVDGYQVKLGVAFNDESGQASSATQTSALLMDAVWRQKVVTALTAAVGEADGIDLDFEALQPSARSGVTTFVQMLAASLHAKSKKIAVYVPPSTTSPSDVAGGDAYDLASFDGKVDRVRLTTLDYSDGSAPGPTTDPGWAVTAYKFARAYLPNTPMDVSYPLYGADFGPHGVRGTSWLEARALADQAGIVTFDRGPTGTPHFTYSRAEGDHQVWFDDAVSTETALAAWGYDSIPANTGVFFWGFGAEDPALWNELARRLP